MSKILTSGKLVRAGFYPISPSGPVLTSFQVDIEIYEDKLGQSGDRILSSHITKLISVYDVYLGVPFHSLA